MTKKHILMAGLFCLLLSPAQADDHTHFLNVPLSLSPSEMMEELSRRGMQQEDAGSLSGRISGLDVWLRLNSSRDTSSLNSMLLTTRHQQGRTLRDDYRQMMKWMRQHYGAPTWESTVRGHAFARWYVGFDRDIVMIATAKQTVDVWFYNNHSKRNVDYYSILKYCERNPSDEVPYYTAREQVTWRSTTPPTVRKASSKASKVKGKRRGRVVKATKARSRVKAKARTKRRRR